MTAKKESKMIPFWVKLNIFFSILEKIKGQINNEKLPLKTWQFFCMCVFFFF